MTPQYYEIIVSLHGVHLFATAERSINNLNKAEATTKLLREKFPEIEGYRITCKGIYSYGEFIKI